MSVATSSYANLLQTILTDYLTFSFLQTNTDTFANSADLDKTAHNEPSHHFAALFWLK